MDTRLKDELRREFFRVALEAERLPEPVPLNLRVLSKRTFLEYEEWKIEYDVETAETMLAEAGWRVPAYLLIPRGCAEPMPAMVCFHQCAEDCTSGKEAVVGKVPWIPVNNSTFFPADGRVSIDRSDQAFGYELVHEGFVVLAPDSINCGERNIPAIRKPGEIRICHHIIEPHLGKDVELKRTTDAVRAVDVLESLDFVDSQRIGAAGHSMGAGAVFALLAIDDRVKAGMTGSRHEKGTWARFYPLIAPKLYMAHWGIFDPGDQDKLQEAYDYALECYERAGAPENILIHKLEAGHRFADEFKWEAYKKLKKYFGILSERELISLVSVSEEARRVTASAWTDARGTFPEIVGRDCTVVANRQQMLSAISGLFLYLTDRSLNVTLTVSVEAIAGRPCLRCICTSDHTIPKKPTPSDYESLRGVNQILAEHDAELDWEHSGKDLIYRVIFARDVV